MIDLDLTFKDYVALTDKSEYDFAIKYAKKLFNDAEDIYKIGDLTQQNFGIVKEMQADINNLTWDRLIYYIKKLTNLNDKKIGGSKLISLCQFVAYLKSEVERINEIETKLLGHINTDEEKRAGIEDFQAFGAYCQVRALTNGDITKVDEIENTKYDTCLTELYYQKVSSEFSKRLTEIRINKH